MWWLLRLPIWSSLCAVFWFYGLAAGLLACVASFFAMWATVYECEVDQ